MPFDDKQKAELAAKLEASFVKPPPKGKYGSYIEGWRVISEANRIFGFDGWSYSVDALTVTNSGLKGDNHAIGYLATVTVTAGGVSRQDVGHGQGHSRSEGDAHDSAVKEAVTDALKRCLRTFGNPFGLALYDKAQEGVEKAPQQGNAARAVAAREPAPAPVEDPMAEIERNMLATIANMTDPNKLDRLAVSARFSGDLAHLPDDRRGRVEKALRTRRDTLANPVMAG